jgi:hypothetical protein
MCGEAASQYGLSSSRDAVRDAVWRHRRGLTLYKLEEQ